jgi:hypothetical protein
MMISNRIQELIIVERWLFIDRFEPVLSYTVIKYWSVTEITEFHKLLRVIQHANYWVSFVRSCYLIRMK